MLGIETTAMAMMIRNSWNNQPKTGGVGMNGSGWAGRDRL
jgi:hypothetical protein